MKKLLFILVGLTLGFAQVNWKLDKSHSSIGFSVTHMVITDVEGSFGSFEGKVSTVSDQFENPSVDLKINVSSINTGNEGRDKHLKAADFFDQEKFPFITFKSKSYKKVSGNKYKLTGDFTIKDVTKEIVLDVEQKGPIKDFSGKSRYGFKISGSIDRFDYGLKWNTLVEAGPVVGKEITFVINVQIIKE